MSCIVKNQKYMGSVKVGPKGQIVIPKEIRDMFDIQPGSTLLILADANRGIAIERQSVLNRISEAILSGCGKDIFPEEKEENLQAFVRKMEEARETDHDSH